MLFRSLARKHESEEKLIRCLTSRERNQLVEYLRRIFDHECNGATEYGIGIVPPAKPSDEEKPVAGNRAPSTQHNRRGRARDRNRELRHRLKQMERQFVQLREALRQVVRAGD